MQTRKTTSKTSLKKIKLLNYVIQEPFRARLNLMSDVEKGEIESKMLKLRKTIDTSGKKKINKASVKNQILVYTTNGKTISFDNIIRAKPRSVK